MSIKENLASAVLRHLSDAEVGLSVRDLERALSPRHANLNRRTLQRAISELLAEGRISREGSGPATTYEIATPQQDTGLEDISLTPGSRVLLDYLALPVLKRKPVTYRPEILYDYIPNRDFYLTEDLRDQLHDMGRTGADGRPAGTHLRNILGRILIDLSWASSRLEGNRYSLLDTKRLIEEGKAAEGLDRIEAVMILNHKAAIEMIAEDSEHIGLDRFTFLNLHALLADGLMRDEEAVGRLRRRPVDISGSVYTPMAIPQKIEDCFGVILEKAGKIHDPFEASFFVLAHVPYLQPFEDVNKRVSRLGCNIPLIKTNLSPLSFVDMPEAPYIRGMQAFYETGKLDLLRDVYLAAYERSCQRYAAISKSMVEPDPFRLAWRGELYALVHHVVSEGLNPSVEVLSSHFPANLPEKDREAFLTMAEREIADIHEGNFMRYKLRPAQFQAWMERAATEENPSPM